MTAAAWLALVASGAGAVTAPVVIPAAPLAPSGFTGAPQASPPRIGTAGEILSGFSLSTSLTGTYDSNVTQSPGGSVAPIEDDFILRFGGSVSYLSKSTDWTYGGTYRAGYNEYFTQTDFSGLDQGGSLVANYQGGRLSASLTTGVDFDRGGNRYYSSAFVEQTSFRTALTARYKLSAKTSLQGNIGQAYTTSSGNFADTTSYDAGISALWRYSPLTEFGPGLRYTYQAGGGSNARTSVGPNLNLNYKLSTKIALNSRVGMDFTKYESGGSSDPSLSASIGLNYQASRLWSASLTFYRDSQADPSVPGAFTQITSIRAGYQRKIRRVSWNLGLGYESAANQSGGSSTASRPDRNFVTFDTSLSLLTFANTTTASVFLRYSDQTGGTGDSYQDTQVGVSLSRSF